MLWWGAASAILEGEYWAILGVLYGGVGGLIFGDTRDMWLDRSNDGGVRLAVAQESRILDE